MDAPAWVCKDYEFRCHRWREPLRIVVEHARIYLDDGRSRGVIVPILRVVGVSIRIESSGESFCMVGQWRIFE